MAESKQRAKLAIKVIKLHPEQKFLGATYPIDLDKVLEHVNLQLTKDKIPLNSVVGVQYMYGHIAYTVGYTSVVVTYKTMA